MSKKLPFVKSDIPRDLRMFLDRVRELVGGSGTDRLVSLDDLTSAGLASTNASGAITAPTQTFVAPPPAPTSVTATASVRTIIVSWNAPAYSGHAYAEVWGASSNLLGAAVLLGMTPGGIYVDETGPSTTRYYWVRFVNVNDDKGPYNATSGTSATTGPEVDYLLDQLAGEITTAELSTSLNSRINLIDGPASTPGTIPNQLAFLQGQVDAITSYPDYDNGTTYAADDIVKYEGGLYKAISSTTGNLPTNATYWLKIGDYSSLADVVAAHTAEIATLTTDLGGEVTARETLATQMRGAYTGTDLASVTSGLVYSERVARTTADAGLASSISSVSATAASKNRIFRQTAEPTSPQVNDIWVDTKPNYAIPYFSEDYSTPKYNQYQWDGSSWLDITNTDITDNFALVVNEQVARASADEVLASDITTLSVLLNTETGALAAAIEQEAIARADADEATASDITTLQSQVTSGNETLTAAIQTEASTRAAETGSLFAKYTVKVDVNGYVSGFGLASTANNAAPFSIFSIIADKFTIAPVASNLSDSGAPFFHLTSPAVVDGAFLQAGTYMKSAFIHDATIDNAKIADLAVDDAKIANLTVDKLTAGSIAAGQYIQSSNYVPNTQGFRLDANGNAYLQNAVVRGTVYATDGQFVGEVIAEDSGGNKARMWSGNFEIYKQVPTVGLVLYKTLSRVESGVGTNNVSVTIPGYFTAQPRVIVSPANMTLYNKDYANQSQSVQCEARDLVETFAGSMSWRFTPLATLSLAANTGQTVINQTSGTLSTGWTSSQYTTPANTASITPNITLTSLRGTGTSGNYYLRTVRWKIEYLSGGTWVSGSWTTTALGASAPATITTNGTFTFPSSGTWTFRIVAEAYDSGGTFNTGTQYETATDNISRTGNALARSTSSTVTTIDYAPSYSLPSGWSIVSVQYSYVYSYGLGTSNLAGAGAQVYGSGVFESVGPNSFIERTNLSKTFTASSNSLLFSAQGSTFGSSSSGSAEITLHSATGIVTRRRPLTNSTTASNSFSFNYYDYNLTSAQVLATGTLNWIAIGE